MTRDIPAENPFIQESRPKSWEETHAEIPSRDLIFGLRDAMLSKNRKESERIKFAIANQVLKPLLYSQDKGD